MAPKVLPTAISLSSPPYQHITLPHPHLLRSPLLLTDCLPFSPILRSSLDLQSNKGRYYYSPHPRKQLHQPTIPIRNTHHQIWLRQPPRLHINQAKHKRRQRERAQPQWRRVAESAIFDLFVQTRLGFAAECGQAGGLVVGGDVGEGAVAVAGGVFGGGVFVCGHVFGDVVVVRAGWAVGGGGVARVGGIGLGGHGE